MKQFQEDDRANYKLVNDLTNWVNEWNLIKLTLKTQVR